jgi:hypothetical protein
MAHPHLELGELDAVDPAVGRPPQQDVRGDRQPPGHAPGEQRDGIERAVVRLRLRQQREAGLQPAHVADDQRANPHPARPAAIGADGHPHGPVAQVPNRRDRVGEPAEPLLERFAGPVQHVGIKAQAGHHDEQLPVDPAGVDRPLNAAERDLERLLQAQREADIASQQVAGAQRDDRQADPGAGDALRARGHRPVAAAGEDEIDPGRHRRLSLAQAGILRRRLQPERLVPAVIAHGLAHRFAECLVVIQLGRVHHDCGPAHRLPSPCNPADHQVPQASAGAVSSGGVRNAGGAVRSSAPSGEIAAASRRVSAGRFHFSSTSFSTEVWSNTSDSTQSGRA